MAIKIEIKSESDMEEHTNRTIHFDESDAIEAADKNTCIVAYY